MNIEILLLDNAARCESLLDTLTSENDPDYGEIFEAVRYSLLGGGKRIRPFLVNSFSAMFGGDPAIAAKLGCALEMIHTYSLIHDDMPCMDDDELRRGRPTNHVVYGEATAMLAGDALLTMAFEMASSPEIPAETAKAAVRLLSRQAGTFGMIGGQMLDLKGEHEHLDFDTLLKMHAKKTGALMEAACLLGCYAAGIFDPDDIHCIAAKQYAKGIGLAFQIIDDRLDVIGNNDILGKPVGSDAESGKTTFLSFMSPEQALDYAKDLTEQAKNAILPFHGKEPLLELADYLLYRNK
ncbi:MAG: polyprenyl synthetase family protein [Clostridia bacterium]|nr:polyprenyl synthetase family protein [Clostridia bacterium]